MKLLIKFSSLTNDQRKQVKQFYQGKEELLFCNLNQMRFAVNASNGSVMFFKDF